MARFVKIKPDDFVDAIQLKAGLSFPYNRSENYSFSPGSYHVGNVGYWLVNDGDSQYVISDYEFHKKFRRVDD